MTTFDSCAIHDSDFTNVSLLCQESYKIDVISPREDVPTLWNLLVLVEMGFSFLHFPEKW